MKSILHVTAHMGGGVGKVLSSITKYNKDNKRGFKHSILILEKPEKTLFIDICQKFGIEVITFEDLSSTKKIVSKFDIVQIEWWHHPKTAKILYELRDIPMRLIIWSHISGCSYPIIPYKFLRMPHSFIFSSEYSYENMYWSKEQRKQARVLTKVINSSGGFESIFKKNYDCSEEITIGYSGTLDFSKLNCKFVEILARFKMKKFKVLILGDIKNREVILRQLENHNLQDKVQFLGFQNNIYSYLDKLDLFIYPLNKNHYGTTENMLLEVMAYGLPVVAFNQCAEKYIIKNNITGYLANDVDEFSEKVNLLSQDKELRKRIGKNASKDIYSNYSIENTVNKLTNVYSEVVKLNKRRFDFSKVFGTRPNEWFISCLGEERKYFEDSKRDIEANQINQVLYDYVPYLPLIIKGESKSSIQHFYKNYPCDVYLKAWNEYILR